jgi:methanogenic corrinoid protein MtbC1
MTAQTFLDAYINALFDTDKEAALQIIQSALDADAPPESVVFDVVVPGLEQMIGGMINDNHVTLSQHFLAAQIADEVVDRLLPMFTGTPEVSGRVVIGSSFGDFHGLGKKIVIGCLRARMFQVKDLGINVAPEKFVEEAISYDADVIAISAMMMHTANSEQGAKKVRQLLQAGDLEDRFKIIVGGAPYRFHEKMYLDVGADAWANSAAEAPDVISRLVKEVHSK